MTPRKNAKTDRHKPARQIRLNLRLSIQLEKVAERNATSLSVEVNRAVREMLERAGLWPPPDDAAKKKG